MCVMFVSYTRYTHGESGESNVTQDWLELHVVNFRCV
jgi:hypothetical protein